MNAESPWHSRRAGWGIGGWAIAWLLVGAVALGAAAAGAATGDVTAARLVGTWRLTVSVQSYTSQLDRGVTAAGGGPAVGHVGVETVRFASTCPTVGHCTLRITGLSGAVNVVGASGFVVPGRNSPLPQAGADYSSPIPGGFGSGPCTKNPPPFAYEVNLTVTAAARDATGWHGTALTGTETNLLYSCATRVFWFQHLRISRGVFVPAVPTTTTPTSSPRSTPSTLPQRSTGTPASGATRPSSMARFLPPPRVVFSDPARALANALIALATVLFITFPAHLFNNTLDENYDDIRAFWRRRLAALEKLRRRRIDPDAARPPEVPRVASKRRSAASFVVVSLVGAFLGALLNPDFGFNRSSIATFIATLLAILVGLAVSLAVNIGYRRVRHRSTDARLRALPGGLVVAVGCVLLSRLAHFEPGYLYGIVAGVAFVPLARDEEGHVVALDVGAVLVSAVIAWLVRIPVDKAATGAHPSFLVVTLDDLLAALIVASLVGSVLSLFPLRFLPGAKLAAWRRGAWAAVFGLAVFALTELMLHPPGRVAHPGGAPITTVILLFVGFGGGSVAFAAYFARRKRPAREPARS